MPAGRHHALVRITFRQAVEEGLIGASAWCASGQDGRGRGPVIKQIYDFYGDNSAEELDVIPSRRRRLSLALC